METFSDRPYAITIRKECVTKILQLTRLKNYNYKSLLIMRRPFKSFEVIESFNISSRGTHCFSKLISDK